MVWPGADAGSRAGQEAGPSCVLATVTITVISSPVLRETLILSEFWEKRVNPFQSVVGRWP